MTKIVSEERAKQGRKGWHVFMVLVGGLFLAGLVWVGVEIYGEAIDPLPAASTTATDG